MSASAVEDVTTRYSPPQTERARSPVVNARSAAALGRMSFKGLLSLDEDDLGGWRNLGDGVENGDGDDGGDGGYGGGGGGVKARTRTPVKLTANRRFNSTSSWYSMKTTMANADSRTTMIVIAHVMLAHMRQVQNRKQSLRQSEMWAFFDDSHEAKITRAGERSVFREGSSIVDRGSPKNLSQDFMEQSLPSVDDIVKFMSYVFVTAQLVIDSLIIGLVYLERLLTEAAKDNAGLTPRNWKTLVFMSLALASKIWDDLAMENGDLAVVWRPTTLQRINELERRMLEVLRYNVRVGASEYTKYYFSLRELVTTLRLPGCELRPGGAAMMRPLKSVDAAKLAELTDRYAKRSLVTSHAPVSILKRSKSENDADGEGSKNSNAIASVDEFVGDGSVTRSASGNFASWRMRR